MGAAFNQMLLASWRQRDRDAPGGRRLLAALALLGLGVTLYTATGVRLAVLAVSAVLALAMLWMALVGNLLQQNHPHAARLVPGHVRWLREAALGSWMLLSLACALLLWAGLPRLPSLAAALLFVAAVLVLMAWALRNWNLLLLLTFGPALFFGLDLGKRLAPLWSALQQLWSAQTLPVLALCLLALGGLVARLFGPGDAAHREAHARIMFMRRIAREGTTGKQAGLAAFGRPGEWLARPFERIASAWLAHAIGRAAATRRSVMSRAEIVLHGQQHWLRQALGVALALCIAALSFLLAFAIMGQGWQDGWQHGALGIAIGVASAGFNPCLALPQMLWHSRREQALLRLLPGMPQGAALNRAVGGLQLRHGLVAWALTSLALALLAWVGDDIALMCLALGALPLSVTWLLRAPARLRAPMSWTAVLPVLAFLAMSVGLYLLHHKLRLSFALLAGASLAASLALGLWRWRVLAAAPVALPAGRLA
ncbi:hypothetical protein [Roseateles sp.]|uniref:hypothetical protein n=1 Tax=Roseateles sp. TaxID=1971397 RepID=UPI0025E6632E|nr:hypothetical protein [Roseateles sp.]MBV8036104.1 hypothetical protein [Roseateles sp.]